MTFLLYEKYCHTIRTSVLQIIIHICNVLNDIQFEINYNGYMWSMMGIEVGPHEFI